MSKEITVTEEGLKKLQDELEYLKTTKRKEVVEAIRVALSFGDLSENSEYDEARDAQAKNEARISELEELIKNAKIVDESAFRTGVVNIGTAVKVHDETFDEDCEYTIVGSNQVNAATNHISDQSPIGAALIGAKAGDTVTYTAPCGEVTLKVLSVKRAKN